MLVAALRPPRIWSAPSFEAQPSLLDASAGSVYVAPRQAWKLGPMYDLWYHVHMCSKWSETSNHLPSPCSPSSRGDILDSCRRWYRTWWSRLCMCLRLCVRGVGNVIWFKSNSQDLRPFKRNIFLPTNACIQFTASSWPTTRRPEDQEYQRTKRTREKNVSKKSRK